MRAPEHGVAARTYAYAPRILQANGMIPKTMRRPSAHAFIRFIIRCAMPEPNASFADAAALARLKRGPA